MMIKLDLNGPEGRTGIHSRIQGIYDRIAGGDDYRRNESSLGRIQFCVITASACATGGVNAFAHKDRIGWIGACLLAVLIVGFVEKFYFTLRHGLTTTYKSGMQRLAATACYRIIQCSMALNAAVLCAWIVTAELPPWLSFYNRWSLVIHFTMALIGVPAVRDSDPVVAHNILELKAETAKQDLITLRKAATLGSPLLLFAAKLRGTLDGAGLAWALLRGKTDFAAGDAKEILEVPRAEPAKLDNWSGLYLMGESREPDQDSRGTSIEGKRWRR